MVKKEKNGVLFLQFPCFKDYTNVLWHGIFTRKNGYSQPPYDSLNVSFDVGDEQKHVEKNRELIQSCSGAEYLSFVNQVHGTEVIICNQKHSDKAAPLEGDAIVTDKAGKFLVIQVADCQAILMFDPIKKVVANVHSGWRSSIRNIAGKTVNVMKESFGSKTSNIIAGIAPSLGPCCTEFKNYKNEFDQKFLNYKKSTCFFDFWKATCDQLCNAGVNKNNIYTADICTRCNTDTFFSYRKEKNTGRFAAVIGLLHID
mmetsp:Transcript_23295/g.11225  ORF Transcript_23295/g.11225 Transcript_23295/m.11225 type:complete len:257 (+) Transcript_23295:134-904(+)